MQKLGLKMGSWLQKMRLLILFLYSYYHHKSVELFIVYLYLFQYDCSIKITTKPPLYFRKLRRLCLFFFTHLGNQCGTRYNYWYLILILPWIEYWRNFSCMHLIKRLHATISTQHLPRVCLLGQVIIWRVSRNRLTVIWKLN